MHWRTGTGLDHLTPDLEILHAVFGAREGPMIQSRQIKLSQRRIVDHRHCYSPCSLVRDSLRCSFRNPSTALLNASGRSILLKRPAPSIIVKRAPGILRAISREVAGGVRVSSAPTTTCVGTAIASSSSTRV